MVAMAAVNAGLAAAGHSQLYVDFIDDTDVEVHRRAWETLVAPQPLPWVLALIGFEAAVGVRGGRSPGRIRSGTAPSDQCGIASNGRSSMLPCDGDQRRARGATRR